MPNGTLTSGRPPDAAHPPTPMRTRRATITAFMSRPEWERRLVRLQAAARRWLVRRRLRTFINLRALRMAVRREREQMRSWLKLLFCTSGILAQVAFIVHLRQPELISSINQAVASYISAARAPDPSCVGSTRRDFEESVLRECMVVDEHPVPSRQARVSCRLCCIRRRVCSSPTACLLCASIPSRTPSRSRCGQAKNATRSMS